ncbi:MAG: hypothetical protein L3V56_00355 [Candidatus Magnetoovum sp. WYHC-5]|nr:hypothetical protein [Candidatus Magnetoovum sp. WYHC-5]
MRTYLPERYKVDSGFVVDYKGKISEQIDIIIYDRNFTPFIFRGESVIYIPAEGVYAVFEVKTLFDKTNYDYAVNKLNSVKELERTSAPFTHIKGKDTKELFDIIGGILTKKNKSTNYFSDLEKGSELTIIVCLDHGIRVIHKDSIEKQDESPKLSFFLLKLIEILRGVGSVPALDVDKYLESIK